MITDRSRVETRTATPLMRATSSSVAATLRSPDASVTRRSSSTSCGSNIRLIRARSAIAKNAAAAVWLSKPMVTVARSCAMPLPSARRSANAESARWAISGCANTARSANASRTNDDRLIGHAPR
jgi:hypothetical protein